jgi:hypothetical protein
VKCLKALFLVVTAHRQIFLCLSLALIAPLCQPVKMLAHTPGFFVKLKMSTFRKSETMTTREMMMMMMEINCDAGHGWEIFVEVKNLNNFKKKSNLNFF